jgi:hypothetical protein
MSNENNNRVLSRMGARQLTRNEIDEVTGALAATLLSVILTSPASNPDHRLDS